MTAIVVVGVRWLQAVRAALPTIAVAMGFAGTLMNGVAAPARAEGFPSGPWRFACFNAYLDGNYLRAHCRSGAGKLNDTIYDMRDCITRTLDVVDGRLTCVPNKLAAFEVFDNVLPRGEWLWFCRGGYIDRERNMRAQCLNSTGNYRPTSMPIQSCAKNSLVTVNNGKLICDGRLDGFGQFADTGVPGTWRTNCRQAFFDSNRNLYALCRDNAGRMQPSKLNLPSCPPGATVSAVDGQLRCP